MFLGEDMKTILCFGDSNTWGWNPEAVNQTIADRFSPEKRWTGILQSKLGQSFSVIEEGLCGRTTILDDPFDQYRNGKEYLIPCLHSHSPLDFVVIMLGTNDLKTHFAMTASDIACGIEILVSMVKMHALNRHNSVPHILVLTPPPVGKLNPPGDSSWEGAQDKSMQVSENLKISAEKNGYQLLDMHDMITSEELNMDGIHLSDRCHKKLGEAVASKIVQMSK
jgi:lysophospholipase L1-like esterase